MIGIKKQPEPQALLAYRKQAEASYDGASFSIVKADIRSSLLREQGYLCAYCMNSIEDDPLKMKVEHWQSQSHYPERQLDYKNMLAVCKGNEGREYASQHCDTRKGNQELSINPAEPAHSIQEKIRYLGSGKLKLDDPILNDQINQVLNLNYYRLNENRKAVIDAVQHVLARTKGSATTGGLQRLLQDWSSLDRQGKHKSFCGAAIYYLNKKLERVKK